MKIGFFMGSFDPIHIGHINVIREALDKASLDKVIVVPSGHNPWKKDIEPAPFDLRVAMIAAAIKPFGDKVEVSSIESTFEPPFYSNKPLKYFIEKYIGEKEANELYIICGSDTAEKIPFWKNAEEDIIPYYTILAFDRKEDKLEKSTTINYAKGPSGKYYPYTHFHIEPFPVSSTLIRIMTKEKECLYPLLPEEVIKIIEKNNLYKNEKD